MSNAEMLSDLKANKNSSLKNLTFNKLDSQSNFKPK